MDYYEDADGDLAEIRASIAAIDIAEAEFQRALAAWEAARGVTAEEFKDVLKASEVVQRAQEALEALTAQLVNVPDAPTAQAITEANNDLVEAQDYASDLGVVEAFVNERLSEYVTEAEPSDFQNDMWNVEVLDFFDGKGS